MLLFTAYFNNEETIESLAKFVTTVSGEKNYDDKFGINISDIVMCLEGTAICEDSTGIYFEVYDSSMLDYVHIPFTFKKGEKTNKTIFTLDMSGYKRLRKFLRKRSSFIDLYDKLFLNCNFDGDISDIPTELVDLNSLIQSLSDKYKDDNQVVMESKMAMYGGYTKYDKSDFSNIGLEEFLVDIDGQQYIGTGGIFSNLGRYIVLELEYLKKENESYVGYAYKKLGFMYYDNIEFHMNLLYHFKDVQDALLSTEDVKFISFQE